MRLLNFIVIGEVLLLIGSASVAAQSSESERRIEERARIGLQPTEQEILAGEDRFVMDYGVWINYYFTKLANDDNNEAVDDLTSATFAVDPRLWIRATLRSHVDSDSSNEHSLYVRFKDLVTWREPSDVNGSFDRDGPHLDYAFVTLDFQPLVIQAGRRFFQAGQGLSYSNVGDGIELMVSGDVWSLMGFASRSLPHDPNIDTSIPSGKDSGRMFYGIESRYIGFIGHGLYSYAVFQKDDGDESPNDATQEYDYDSQYFGFGSEGTAIPNVRYAAELILQTGNSFTSITSERETVLAWAMDVSLVYDVQSPLQPTIYGEYAFGSGDSDRGNVTNTFAGNSVGKDTNFLYFGFLPTGYALSPRVSNLRMFKVGAALNPFESVTRFNLNDLTVSVDVYRYFKDESKGAIFDFEASNDDDDIGYEFDLTLSWPVLSDMSVDLEYGRFEPGDAYPSDTDHASNYFAVGITTTF